MYKAIIVTLKALSAHTNADRLQIASIYGNSVIVGIDNKAGEKGLFFPVGCQLSSEFCTSNDLVAQRDSSGNKIGGGYLEANRAIKATKLRGTKSEGLWLPISALDYILDPECRAIIDSLKEGDSFEDIGTHHICKRYYPRDNRRVEGSKRSEGRAKKLDPVTFKKHFDTENIKYYLHELQPGDEILVTSKLHGTSTRHGYARFKKTIEVERPAMTFMEKVKSFFGAKFTGEDTIWEWRPVCGTRNVILDDDYTNWSEGNKFRIPTHKAIVPALTKGLTVYGEIVGWEDENTPIMHKHSTDKLQDKDLKKLYPKEIVYSYGQDVGTNDFYIYRVTYTNEDGNVHEFSWDQVVKFCKSWGFKTVPYIDTIRIVQNNEDGVLIFQGGNQKSLMSYLETFDTPDAMDNRHPKEGVCLRNTRTDKIYKYKTYTFSVLEGIAIEVSGDKEDEN